MPCPISAPRRALRLGLPLTRVLIASVLLTALGSPVSLVFAQRIVVTTSEGRELEGELIRHTPAHVVMRVGGIEARLDSDRIASMQHREDVQFARAAPRVARGATVAAAAQRRDPGDRLRRLTQSDINRIRVFEVDLEEEPRIQIPRPTLQAFLDRYAGRGDVPTDRTERGRFLRAPGYEQLAVMFDVRAREFYGDVVVRDEPAPLLDFRRRIHTQYVLNYCGTNTCHGGDDAPGNLRLIRGTDVDTVYTNFYILHSYENEDGYMIDRDRPDRSLLLQYGLAPNAARHPHPPVPGWRQRFNDPSHRFFEQYVEVIESLWRPRPDYGIDYHPPGMPEPEEDG